MSSSREMRLRIRSVKNIAQVTRALETVSASKVRKATQSVLSSRPYATKALQVLTHLAGQPGRNSLHPLLSQRDITKRILILMVSGDRGLAGAYNVNILRHTLQNATNLNKPVSFAVIGKKGRDLLIRRNLPVIAEFSNLPSPAKFMDVVAVGRLLVDDYLTEEFDQVYLSFTEFISMSSQVLKFRKLLPLELDVDEGLVSRTNSQSVHKYDSPFTYEPDQYDVLNQIIPRFTAIQVFQAILSAQASEHASRMLAMRNATDNANELVGMLQLDYNKMRQQAITNDMLDIVSGANALVEIG